MSPADLKARLVADLETIDGLEHRPSPVAGGSALFYRNRPLAHFHHDGELDLRLGRQRIQIEGLRHPPDSAQHPHRAAGSPWIELRFATVADVERVAGLVRRAIAGG